MPDRHLADLRGNREPGRDHPRGRDPAVPQPNGLRRERRPDHRRGVRAPDQHQHRKQHMCHPTSGAPRPPRDDPYRAARAADRPRAGPTPPGQRPHAPRTRQPARTQPFLDRAGVDLYREHRASERNHTALPHSPAKDNSGRAVAYPDPKIVTVAAPTNTVNTTRPDPTGSTRSTARTSPYVVILGGA